MVDIPGNSSTTQTISVGGTTSDTLEVVGDHDWYRIDLIAGQSISIALSGITLEDPMVRVRDASGNIIYENDDINPGIIRDSLLAFTASYSGTFYIDVGAWDDDYAGTYQLSVTTYAPPAVATIQQVSDQLVNGYWGGDSHHFNASPGGTLTVNLTGLTVAGQYLARAALATWSDIIGVSFLEVGSGGQIIFDDDQEGAFSESHWSDGIISWSFVNVSTEWLATYGTATNSYSFQAYVHEIGHALGLGHAGNYNESARYPYDASFENDGWPVSIMSYFSQQESSYYAGKGFDENYAVTPMMADILAMNTLYGLSGTTRLGDTVYGPSWTSDMGAICLFDSGGVDTIDVSGFGGNQQINLNPGTFSNVLGEVGNVSIALGVYVENAVGGSGNDTLIGNAGNNILAGGGGDDTVSYETALGAVRVDLRTTAPQDTVGAGQDTLSGIERLNGSGFHDTLIGASDTVEIHGRDGNDQIYSTGLGSHALHGDGGDDWITPGQGDDWIYGGDGFDTVDYGGATGPISVAADTANNNTGSSGYDSLSSIEKIIGSAFNDTLKGSTTEASQLHGGGGNDTYVVRNAANQVVESAGQGIDLVLVEANYTLAANVENLTLLQPVYDPYAGPTIAPPPFADFYGYGSDLANVIVGNAGANILSGMAGADTLTGGNGNDIFRDTAAGLNGDTITDFTAGDKIVISNASLAEFSFSLSGNTLTFTGGSLTLSGFTGQLQVSIAPGGGVQLTVETVINDARNDFNGDGRSDVLWHHSSGRVTDWLGQPNGGFASNLGNFDGQVGTDWHVAGTGDFNGDGRDDVLWRNDGGAVTNWLGQSNGGFLSNFANAYGVLDNGWSVAGTGDFNGDGRDDVLWHHSSGRVTDWLGQANGGFVSNLGNFDGQVGTDWHIVGTGDFNGDGRDDVLWRSDSGAVTNWLGQANGGFASNFANAYGEFDTGWHVAGVGDFNGDGRDDVLWHHSSGRVTNWLGQANGGFAGNFAFADAQAGTDWDIASVGDYNGDGRDDVLWRNESGAVTNWLGQPNGGFASNFANAYGEVDNSWHVLPMSEALI